jgi:hypothetical protein
MASRKRRQSKQKEQAMSCIWFFERVVNDACMKTQNKKAKVSSQVVFLQSRLHDGVLHGTENQLDVLRVWRRRGKVRVEPDASTTDTGSMHDVHRDEAKEKKEKMKSALGLSRAKQIVKLSKSSTHYQTNWVLLKNWSTKKENTKKM